MMKLREHMNKQQSLFPQLNLSVEEKSIPN